MNYKQFKNITLFGLHGHAIQEKELGQKFVLDITLFGRDLQAVRRAVTDEQVEQFVQEEAVDVSRDMIQAVAWKIAEKILDVSDESILEVRVEVKKPSTPVRIGMPGGLIKYVSSTISKRRDGYQSEYTHLEDYNYTKIRSARIFDRDVRMEVDLEVAFPQDEVVQNDNVDYSYSYTTIYDVAVDTVKNNKGDDGATLAQKMVDYVYGDNPNTQMVRATVRNYLPENNLSVDYMEYQIVQ